MKITVKLSALFIAVCMCLTLCACNGSKSSTGDGKFVIPENLMTTEEYHSELQKLLDTQNFSTLDETGLKKIDEIGNRLEEMIKYNTDDITECTGTKYYVSNNGNDSNDGKSESTAWATLDKINSTKLNEGDLVLFERGGFWRGSISAQSGVSYSAYGTGFKPKFYCSIDGKEGEWTQTDDENIWVYSEKLSAQDICSVVFNVGTENEDYADKVSGRSKLKKDKQFTYMFGKATDRPVDFKVYMYSTEGNPAERFDTIEFSVGNEQLRLAAGSHDITFNNLDLYFGTDHFFSTGYTNITMSYCQSSWVGGNYDSNNTRLGGGGGAWRDCDTITYDHCYFKQQFDAGISPQYNGSDDVDAIFKNFKVADCLFEACEYTFEYFNTQKNSLKNSFENFYFGYNFCRKGGYGFGDKTSASSYVKSWGHENSCYDCKIEYNVFDRAASNTLEIIGYEQSESGNTKSYERIPKLNNNIYIQKKDKKFANINGITYKYNEKTYEELERLGVETGAVYMFCE